MSSFHHKKGHRGFKDHKKRQPQAPREEKKDHSPITGVLGDIARLGDVYLLNENINEKPSFIIDVTRASDSVISPPLDKNWTVETQLNELSNKVLEDLTLNQNSIISTLINAVISLPTKSYVYASLCAMVSLKTPSFMPIFLHSLSESLVTSINTIILNTTGNPSDSPADWVARLNTLSEEDRSTFSDFRNLSFTGNPSRFIVAHSQLALMMRFIASLAALRVIPPSSFFQLVQDLFRVAQIANLSPTNTTVGLWDFTAFAQPTPFLPSHSSTKVATSTPIIVTPLCDSIVRSVLGALPFLSTDLLPSSSPFFNQDYFHDISLSQAGAVDIDCPLEDLDDFNKIIQLEADKQKLTVSQVLDNYVAELRQILTICKNYIVIRDSALRHSPIDCCALETFVPTEKDARVTDGKMFRDELEYTFYSITGQRAVSLDGETTSPLCLLRPLSIFAPGFKLRHNLKLHFVDLTNFSLTGVYSNLRVFQPSLYTISPVGNQPSVPHADLYMVSLPLSTPPVFPHPISADLDTVSPVDIWLVYMYIQVILTTYDSLHEVQLMALLTLPALRPLYGNTQYDMLVTSVNHAIEDGKTKQEAGAAFTTPALTNPIIYTRTTQSIMYPLILRAIFSHLLTPTPSQVQLPIRRGTATNPAAVMEDVRSFKHQMRDIAIAPPASLHRLLVELVVADKTFARSMGPAFNSVFRNLPLYRPRARSVISDLLAFYLSNVALSWPWKAWEKVMEGTEVGSLLSKTLTHQFLSSIFSKLVRYVHHDIVVSKVNAPLLHTLIPPQASVHDQLNYHGHDEQDLVVSGCNECILKGAVSDISTVIMRKQSPVHLQLELSHKTGKLSHILHQIVSLCPTFKFSNPSVSPSMSLSTLSPLPSSSTDNCVSLFTKYDVETIINQNISVIHPLLAPLWLALLRRSSTNTHLNAYLYKYGHLLSVFANSVGSGQGWFGTSQRDGESQHIDKDMNDSDQINALYLAHQPSDLDPSSDPLSNISPVMINADSNKASGIIICPDGAVPVADPNHVLILDLAASFHRTNPHMFERVIDNLLLFKVITPASYLAWAIQYAPRNNLIRDYSSSTANTSMRLCLRTVASTVVKNYTQLLMRLHDTSVPLSNVVPIFSKLQKTMSDLVSAWGSLILHFSPSTNENEVDIVKTELANILLIGSDQILSSPLEDLLKQTKYISQC